MPVHKIILLPILALGIILSQVSSTVILLNYQVNKEYIAQNLCENRDKPDMDCCGKCVVKKELDKDSQQSKAPGNLKEKEVAKMAVRKAALQPLSPDPFYLKEFGYLLNIPQTQQEIFIPPPESV